MEVPSIVMRRALEHEVLEQMGEPCTAGPLVLRADVVPEVHRDDGTPVVLVYDHVQPVVEHFPGKRQIHAAFSPLTPQ